MTVVTTNEPRKEYTATAGQTIFPYDFLIFADTDLEVYQNGTLLTIGAGNDYTVSGAGVEGGGNVTLTSGATLNDAIIIVGNIPASRATAFTTGGVIRAETLEDELAKILALIKENKRDVDRKVGLAVTSTTDAANVVLPDPSAGAAIVWDGALGALRNTTSSLADLEGDAETVADNIADVNTVAGAIVNVNTTATNIANVNTVGGISANVTTVAGISSDVTTVAGDSADVSTVAGISADITTVAGIATDVTDAANNIPLSNRTATVDPTVNDDIDLGYSAGSLWINTTTDNAFIMTDNTDGAAVWEEFGGGAVTTSGSVSQYDLTMFNDGTGLSIADSGITTDASSWLYLPSGGRYGWTGDTDTYISHTNPDRVSVVAGNQSMALFDANSAQKITTFNIFGADIDFRVQGDTDTELLYVDAGNDRVGISTSTPSYTFDVQGDLNASGDIYQGGSIRHPLTNGTLTATTSGTSIDFTSIPSGTKRITISFQDVSTNGTDAYLIQIGDSGGVETTGYTSHSLRNSSASLTHGSSTSGFIINSGSAATSLIGSVVLTLIDETTNAWVASGTGTGGSTILFTINGDKALSATLDRVRLTTTGGTDAFDAGNINFQCQ